MQQKKLNIATKLLNLVRGSWLRFLVMYLFRKRPKGLLQPKSLSFFYAANIQDDFETLEQLLQLAQKKRDSLVLLGGLFGNPLSPEEQSAYHHAFRHVKAAFDKDADFSDIQQFINTFKTDPSQDIVAISARKILSQIDLGKRALKQKLQHLKKIVAAYSCPLLIVPGTI